MNNDTKTGVTKSRPLTRKQEAFIRYLIEHPKESATEAAAQTYNLANRNTAGAVAAENLQKPSIMAVLADHDLNAQKALAQGLQASKKVYRFNGDSKAYEEVGEEPDHQSRLRAADSILDRLHGKATQRVEQHSEAVTILIDLASMNDQE